MMRRLDLRGSVSKSKPFADRMQAGLTLVELIIAIALGLFIVMAATVLLVSTKSGYLAQDDAARIQDTGRHAIEIISRAVRQAAYENWDEAEAPLAVSASAGANLSGLDARSLKSAAPGIDSPLARTMNGSDVLAVRFFGSGTGDNGDGTMLNCAGFGVAAAPSAEVVEESRGWSIFYVAEDANGEPELYCKYRGAKAWTSQAIASGVESFQVLYGIDTDSDDLPNRFLTATAINELDSAAILVGPDAVERKIEQHKKSFWKKVVAVRIALLVRGEHPAREATSLGAEYDLFGKDYTSAFASSDPGVHMRDADLPKAKRGMARKVFVTTIQLRNRSKAGPA